MPNIKNEAKHRFLAILTDKELLANEPGGVRVLAWQHYKQKYDCCEELFNYENELILALLNTNQDVIDEAAEVTNTMPPELFFFLVGADLIHPDDDRIYDDKPRIAFNEAFKILADSLSAKAQ